MTVIYVLSAIVVVLIFYFAAKKTNQVAFQRYQYIPINGGTIAFNLLPFSMLAAGMVGNNNGEAYAMELGILFALLFIVGLGVWIYKKTSFGIAFISTFMLAIIGFVFILLIIGATASEENQCNQCDDYY